MCGEVQVDSKYEGLVLTCDPATLDYRFYRGLGHCCRVVLVGVWQNYLALLL